MADIFSHQPTRRLAADMVDDLLANLDSDSESSELTDEEEGADCLRSSEEDSSSTEESAAPVTRGVARSEVDTDVAIGSAAIAQAKLVHTFSSFSISKKPASISSSSEEEVEVEVEESEDDIVATTAAALKEDQLTLLAMTEQMRANRMHFVDQSTISASVTPETPTTEGIPPPQTKATTCAAVSSAFSFDWAAFRISQNQAAAAAAVAAAKEEEEDEEVATEQLLPCGGGDSNDSSSREKIVILAAAAPPLHFSVEDLSAVPWVVNYRRVMFQHTRSSMHAIDALEAEAELAGDDDRLPVTSACRAILRDMESALSSLPGEILDVFIHSLIKFKNQNQSQSQNQNQSQNHMGSGGGNGTTSVIDRYGESIHTVSMEPDAFSSNPFGEHIDLVLSAFLEDLSKVHVSLLSMCTDHVMHRSAPEIETPSPSLDPIIDSHSNSVEVSEGNNQEEEEEEEVCIAWASTQPPPPSVHAEASREWYRGADGRISFAPFMIALMLMMIASAVLLFNLDACVEFMYAYLVQWWCRLDLVNALDFGMELS